MATKKLNQINAILAMTKAETEKEIGELYKIIQKEALFSGRSRTYKALSDDGQKLPAENQEVQQNAKDVLKQAAAKFQNLWSQVYTQDTGNQDAFADIVVDDVKIMADVPVTTLLYLDKQLNDLETFVSKLPTPSSDDVWTYDDGRGLFRGKTTETLRTSKEPMVIVKYEATEHHPAQTEIVHKDVPMGYWSNTMFSEAIPLDEKKSLLDRIRKLQKAVKSAREDANSLGVVIKTVKPLMDYIFGGQA